MEFPVTNPVLVFGLAMVIILLAPMAFERLRIPGIVGLIVVGALVGPSALNLLDRTETFILLGTVGLLYLMFTAGLSLDLNQFSKQKTRSIVFGSISFLFPAVLAVGLTPILIGATLPQAFLVASIVGSHTLLAYPIAQRLGIIKNSAVVMTVGGTMVTDVVSLTILAVVVAAAQGAIDAGFWIRFIGLAGLYVAIIVFLVPVLGRWFFRTVRKQPDIEFVFLMAVLFTGAYAAELVGLAAIIGAFLVGLAMNRLVPPQSPLMTRIGFVGNALFIPFFLLSVGLLVDLRVVVSSLEVWTLALLLAGFVFIGKMAAAHAMRPIFKTSATQAWMSFGLSTPQAAATLAVTLLGFEIGLLDGLFVNAVVVMILLTSLVGPWVVERAGRKLAIEEERQPIDAADAPFRILVPLANPETADELIQIAMMIRDPRSADPIYPLTVTRDGPDATSQVAGAEKLLSHAVMYAAAADVPVVPMTRIDFNIAAGVVRAMKERRISHVVIGWNGMNSARAYIFGSILDQLLKDTRDTIIVSKVDHPVNTTARVILAIPPFAEREAGFPQAIRSVKVLAEQAGADVVVLTPDSQAESVRNVFDSVQPDVTFTVKTLTAWSSLVETLDDLVDPSDLIILLNVREGSMAWRSTLNRLPTLIATRFDANNFLIHYLSEAIGEQLVQSIVSGDASSEMRSAQAMLARPQIVLDLPQASVETVLRTILDQDRNTAASDETDRIVKALLEADPDYSPELQPGVVFYHLHSREVARERLVVGISRDGLQLKGTSSPVHLILVLLVPEEVEVNQYLRRLTIIAQLVPPAESMDRVRNLSSETDVLAFLAERMGAPLVLSQ
jgi:Kef-type K+ transport system membrane component KefB/mannitol/fructose-specific phosphotransferase system IIA component (Ntr-type)